MRACIIRHLSAGSLSWPTALRRLRAFAGEESGAFAMIFGLILIPVVFVVGGAVDYASATTARSLSQEALDAGVLAAAAKNSADNTMLKKFYNSHIINRNLTLSSASVTTTTDASGNTVYVADATYTVKTSFLKLAGISNWTGHTHSEAYTPTQIVSITVDPTNAQGAWSKDVFVFTRDSSGAIISKQTVMTYRYTYPSTKVTTPTIGTWSGTYTIPKYASFGVGLVIYQDMSYRGALVSPVTQYSDDSNASSWIHTTGACSDTNGQTVNMEDGGDSNFLDFVYTMKCTIGVASGSSAHLKN
jgi:Flp pilus assembly protein TadG